MTYYDMRDWDLDKFEISKAKNKKYTAIIRNRINPKKTRRINFGDKRHLHYKDNTGLGAYTHLNHLDLGRRRNYRARHKGYLRTNQYSPSHFSYYFLW